MIAGILIYKWNGRNNMSIQVDDVIKVLSKIYNFIEDDNIVNEENILNYETDDIEPIRVRIYTESNKFDIFKEYSFDDWSLNCDDDFESDYGYKEDILINFRNTTEIGDIQGVTQ